MSLKVRVVLLWRSYIIWHHSVKMLFGYVLSLQRNMEKSENRSFVLKHKNVTSDVRTEQRAIIKFCVDLGKTPIDTNYVSLCFTGDTKKCWNSPVVFQLYLGPWYTNVTNDFRRKKGFFRRWKERATIDMQWKHESAYPGRPSSGPSSNR